MVLATRCGGAVDRPGTRDFTLGVIPGAQDFVLFAIHAADLFEAHDLHPEIVRMLRPANLHLMLAERRVDVGFGGFTTMAIARAQGKDVIVVHGVFSPVNVVFVTRDSPLRSLGDLQGRKLGIFGGPGSSTLTFLAVIARQWYGLDLFDEVELVTAPGAALAHLLDTGDVDAALMGTTESLRFAADGTYRVLVDLSEEYKTRKGRAPAHVTITTNERFADAHPDILRDVVTAYREAVAYVRTHGEIWARYGDSIGMTGDAAVAALREKMGPNLVGTWDATQMAVQEEYLGFVHDILGDEVLPIVPTGLIRDDFTP